MILLMSQVYKNPLSYARFAINVHYAIQRLLQRTTWHYATGVDVLDSFTYGMLQRCRSKPIIATFENTCSLRYMMDSDGHSKDIRSVTDEELSSALLENISKNKDKQVVNITKECIEARKFINEATLKKLFRHYSTAGKPNIIDSLQKYCYKVDFNLYKRNGEFEHYMAKAHCMKGNSEKGLLLLYQIYLKNETLRSFYRMIFRELIQDSVLNRSEASLVIFRKYVIMFSKEFNDNYPLVCLWHLCWSSSWFSDQMLAAEILDSSEALQNIIKDKCVAFCVSVLHEHNMDAVTRMLQTLLKYAMMAEYAKVLEVLFAYKLRNKDLRGCSEIIRNCEILGITLPSSQQGRYIKMLIDDTDRPRPGFKDFKLKF